MDAVHQYELQKHIEVKPYFFDQPTEQVINQVIVTCPRSGFTWQTYVEEAKMESCLEVCRRLLLEDVVLNSDGVDENGISWFGEPMPGDHSQAA